MLHPRMRCLWKRLTLENQTSVRTHRFYKFKRKICHGYQLQINMISQLTGIEIISQQKVMVSFWRKIDICSLKILKMKLKNKWIMVIWKKAILDQQITKEINNGNQYPKYKIQSNTHTWKTSGYPLWNSHLTGLLIFLHQINMIRFLSTNMPEDLLKSKSIRRIFLGLSLSLEMRNLHRQHTTQMRRSINLNGFQQNTVLGKTRHHDVISIKSQNQTKVLVQELI